MRRKLILLTKGRGGTRQKKWHVEFSQRDLRTDIMTGKRYKAYNEVNINTLKSLSLCCKFFRIRVNSKGRE